MALLTYPSAYPFPYWEPYPTTILSETVPETGTHHHHIPVPLWGQKVAKFFNDKDGQVHSPRADVLETSSAFHIDVELPGLENKADLTLKWLSSRTILVSGNIRRKLVADSSEAEVNEKASNGAGLKDLHHTAPSAAQKEGAPNSVEIQAADTAAPHMREEQHKIPPHLAVGERNIGISARAFNFPVDIDRDHTKARLSAGLLTLEVPKRHHEQGSHPEIEVEFEGKGLPLFRNP